VKVINLIQFSVILTYLFFLSCCQTGGRSDLIDPFESQMSVEEAKLMLPPHSMPWEIFIEQPNFKVVHFENYHSLGFVGQLSLVFTNGKLSSTCFITTRIQEYINNLEKKRHIRLKPGEYFWRAKIFPYTVVSVRSDLSDQKICWRDKRFEDSYYYYGISK